MKNLILISLLAFTALFSYSQDLPNKKKLAEVRPGYLPVGLQVEGETLLKGNVRIPSAANKTLSFDSNGYAVYSTVSTTADSINASASLTTKVTNVDSVFTSRRAYTVNKNVVTVYGTFTADLTASDSLTQVNITLPFQADSLNAYGGGAGSQYGSTNNIPALAINIANNATVANVRWKAACSTNCGAYSYSFTYRRKQ